MPIGPGKPDRKSGEGCFKCTLKDLVCPGSHEGVCEAFLPGPKEE